MLAIVPQAVWLIAAHRRDRRVQLAFGAVALCGLALIPLAISQNGTGNSAWIAPIPLDLRLAQVFPQFLIGFQVPAQSVLYPLAAVSVLVGLVLLATRSDPGERRGALVAGGLALGGLVLMLVLVAGGVDDLITRNVIALWPPAAILVAGGLGARRAGWLGLGAAAVLCAAGIVGAIGVATEQKFQRPDWRVVARVLGGPPSRARSARSSCSTTASCCRCRFTFRDCGSCATVTRSVRELDVVSIERSPGPPLLVGRGVQPDRIADAERVPDRGVPRAVAAERQPVHDRPAPRRPARDAQPARRRAGPDDDDAAPRRAARSSASGALERDDLLVAQPPVASRLQRRRARAARTGLRSSRRTG